jgi:hypothetical protein
MFTRRTVMLSLATMPLAAHANRSQESMTMHASGYFDVTLVPQAADNEPSRTAQIDRLSIDKKYHGDLEGTSGGQMQAMKNDRETGAYVALEKVAGTLQGRRGTFMLMHYGYMSEGTVGRWLVEVVPESGTDQLEGLIGTVKIIQKDQRHFYEMEYSLTAPQ